MSVSIPTVQRGSRFHSPAKGAALLVHVTVGPESPTRLQALSNGVLHVHLRGNAQNDIDVLLVDALSRFLGLSPSQIEVVAGTPSRRGQVVVFYDITPTELEKRLARKLGSGPRPIIW